MPTPEEIKAKIRAKKGLSIEEKEPITNGKRKFVLVTHDYSGAGFVLQEKLKNGSEVVVAYKPKDPIKPDKKEQYAVQLKGIADERLTLDDFMEKRGEYKDHYIIFDGNHNTDEGEILHEEGFKVWNGTKFQYDLENDREFGLDFAESVGLVSPPFEHFQTAEQGIAFLEANEEKAYVVKPQGAEESHLTQPFSRTPEDKNANLAARKYLKALNVSDYLLQERKAGVEVNVEIMYSKGKPILAQANLECKYRHNGDLGYPTGCAGDVCWEVPLDCELVRLTAGKFTDKMAELNYTGVMDANVILGDNEVWFLEFCARLGYNAHPNFFSTISRKTCFQSLADLIDGVPIECKKGFGASVTMLSDVEHQGIPIYVPESEKENFYLFDGYKSEDDEENEYSMGGFGSEIAIVSDHAFTVANAFHEAIAVASKIKFVNADYRTDFDKTDFPSSPIRRYEALQALGVL